MMRVWRLSVAYLGPKSRTERRRKTKISTEVAHVKRDSDTTFKVKRSTCRGRGHIVAASRTACFHTFYDRLGSVLHSCVTNPFVAGMVLFFLDQTPFIAQTTVPVLQKSMLEFICLKITPQLCTTCSVCKHTERTTNESAGRNYI